MRKGKETIETGLKPGFVEKMRKLEKTGRFEKYGSVKKLREETGHA